MLLGWQDIKQRYRRSMLGPLWLTISTAVMVIALGYVYAAIFRQSLNDYFPYLAAGLVIWSFISGTIVDGCQTFIASEGIIKQIRVPFFAHVMRVIWRNMIVLGHNAIIIVVVVVLFASAQDPFVLLMFIPGLALVVLSAAWVTLLIGMICARFRDVPQIIANVLQLMFFLTPIIWQPGVLPGRQRVIYWNPLYHFVEVIRAPLLGKMPAAETWLAVIGVTALGWLLTLYFFTQFRRRIAYWL